MWLGQMVMGQRGPDGQLQRSQPSASTERAHSTPHARASHPTAHHHLQGSLTTGHHSQQTLRGRRRIGRRVGYDVEYLRVHNGDDDRHDRQRQRSRSAHVHSRLLLSAGRQKVSVTGSSSSCPIIYTLAACRGWRQAHDVDTATPPVRSVP